MMLMVFFVVVILCITGLRAAWNFGRGEALTLSRPLAFQLQDGSVVHTAIEPPPPALPPPCSYRGDIGHYRERSSVYAELGLFAKDAFLLLANAEHYCDTYVGLSGTPADVASAMRILALDPLADVAFKELVLEGEPPAQLYGLTGVYYTDHEWFLAQAERLRDKELKVDTWFDCMPNIVPIGSVIRSPYELGSDISGGEYPQRFLGDVYGEPPQ